MALLELTQGICNDCGQRVTLAVYWPYTAALMRVVEAGGLRGYTHDDLAAILSDALSVDEFEQDGGDIRAVVEAMGIPGSLFVDGSQEQAVTCPNCGRLIGIIARERVG